MDIFWIDDPKILYEKYQEFIPKKNMSRVQQLNAITRLCIYITILLLIFGKRYVYIPLIVIIFVVVLYNIYAVDSNSKEKFYNRTADTTFAGRNQDEIESGLYDADGNLFLGEEYSVNTKRDKDIAYTLDELVKYQNATCKRPTPDNPFMNPTITDYNTDNPPEACNADDEDIKTQVERNFNANLFMDTDDLFNVKNSQRQFYTIPTPAIPPDQTAFANWCYNIELTCKENQENCLRWEDLKYKSNI